MKFSSPTDIGSPRITRAGASAEWAAWSALVVAGVALRVSLLMRFPDFWYCSDEANLGLMALHLLRAGKFHLFIAGESYGGFLGVLTIAAGTLLTGSPFLGIKLAALSFFVAFAGALFLLARRVFNRSVALVSIALVSLSPSYLTNLGVREKGPHAEMLFLGTLLMFVTVLITDRSQAASSRRLLLAWGALAGFNWYTYYLSVTFIIPCLIYLLLAGQVRQWQPVRWIAAGILEVQARISLPTRQWRTLRWITAGALLGSLPYWLFAWRYRFLPPFGQGSGGLDFFDPVTGIKNFFLIGLPVLVGARWSFSHEDLLPGLSKLTLLLYLFGAIALLVSASRYRTGCAGGRVLLALHLAGYPLLFAFSRFAWFADEPRYLVGLYASLPIALAFLIVAVGRRSRVLAVSLLLLPLSVSVYGSRTVPVEVFNTLFAEPNQPLVRFLQERNIRHFYANYWIVYRLMFETEEQLVGSSYFSVSIDRYPAFKKAVDDEPRPAYIAWLHEHEKFEKELIEMGRSYQKAQVGRYIVFLDVVPRMPPLP